MRGALVHTVLCTGMANQVPFDVLGMEGLYSAPTMGKGAFQSTRSGCWAYVLVQRHIPHFSIGTC